MSLHALCNACVGAGAGGDGGCAPLPPHPSPGRMPLCFPKMQMPVCDVVFSLTCTWASVPRKVQQCLKCIGAIIRSLSPSVLPACLGAVQSAEASPRSRIQSDSLHGLVFSIFTEVRTRSLLHFCLQMGFGGSQSAEAGIRCLAHSDSLINLVAFQICMGLYSKSESAWFTHRPSF